LKKVSPTDPNLSEVPGRQMRDPVGWFFAEPISEELIGSIQEQSRQKEIESEKTTLKRHSEHVKDYKSQLSTTDPNTPLKSLSDMHRVSLGSVVEGLNRVTRKVDEFIQASNLGRSSLNLSNTELSGICDLINDLKEDLEGSYVPDENKLQSLNHIQSMVDEYIIALGMVPDDISNVNGKQDDLHGSPGNLPYAFRHVPREIKVIEVRIQSSLNGEKVPRAFGLRSDCPKDWRVHCELRVVDQEEALQRYTAMKARKLRLFGSKSQAYYGSRFMQNLLRLSSEGRAWRNQVDEMAAKKGPVIFSAHAT